MTTYIGPEKQLEYHCPPTPTELVDQLMQATRDFRHHRTRDNLMTIVKLAQELQSIGYVLVWLPKKGCVGCHRQEARQVNAYTN